MNVADPTTLIPEVNYALGAAQGEKGFASMSPFEVIMLVCFGSGWPVSIVKALRTKQVSGKSPVFMAIICLGYVSGVIHKTLYARDWVIALYVINIILIATDLFLYRRYLPSRQKITSK